MIVIVRRLLRILLGTLKWTGLALSSLLLAGTVVLWVRNLEHREEWEYDRFEPFCETVTPHLVGIAQGVSRRWMVVSVRGRLWFSSRRWASAPWGSSGPTYHGRRTITADAAEHDFDWVFRPGSSTWLDQVNRGWRFAGTAYQYHHSSISPDTGQPIRERYDLVLPFWMLTTIFGLWPLSFVAVRPLRKKRRALNQCPHCEYDLRATPDADGPRLPRCPECGLESRERPA